MAADTQADHYSTNPELILAINIQNDERRPSLDTAIESDFVIIRVKGPTHAG